MNCLLRVAFLCMASSIASGFAQGADEEPPPGDSTFTNPLSSADGRAFVGRLAPHDSIYFVYGDTTPAAKFQFSFKYRVFGEQPEGSRKKYANALLLAYTQRSLWDTEADSSPFYDTSYMPEAIFESLKSVEPRGSGPFHWYGYQLGYRHESNGRDGSLSRNLDALYLRPIFALGSLKGWHINIAPEIFLYTDDLSNNPDIDQYRGYGALRGSILRNNGASLSYMIRSGREFDRITYQLDLSIPIKADFLSFATYFHAQYFNGYGESLLGYREESSALRIGISLVR